MMNKKKIPKKNTSKNKFHNTKIKNQSRNQGKMQYSKKHNNLTDQAEPKYNEDDLLDIQQFEEDNDDEILTESEGAIHSSDEDKYDNDEEQKNLNQNDEDEEINSHSDSDSEAEIYREN